jgi:NIMA (never in mitosis gene a)-related kinase
MVHSIKGYVKIKEIGSGSFGKVSLVKNKDERLFCMKTVDTARMSGKERKQAQNEVKVLSHLKHPYIITYRESFMDNFQLCIVMDYAEGGDLFKVIDRARRKCQSLGEPKILRWITQSLLALKYLHDKHVLHRDLKSQNIFLSSSGRIKLGDFGISKVLESTECFAKTSIGTPYYLAPEICSQKPYSWSADIWALGCILYELCMLRVPFDAQNFKQLCDRITRTKAPGISGSFSASLKEMCATMLSSQPRQRPSAADLLQRPIIQGEIRLMLEEEKQKKESQTEDNVPVPILYFRGCSAGDTDD